MSDELEQKRPRGRPKGSKNKRVYDVHDKIHDEKNYTWDGYWRRPSGNSDRRALRMLRTHRQDLLNRVCAGELSPNAAMVQAGFRHKTASFPIDDMYAFAKALRRQLTPDQREELVSWLGLDDTDWQEESQKWEAWLKEDEQEAATSEQ